MQSLHSGPKHILDLTLEEKYTFLDSFDIVLSDCDGVLWMLSESIPNTGTAVNLLKSCEEQFKFVSGNGMRSDQDYIDKLMNIGVKNVIKSDIVVPYKVVARYMKTNYPNEVCYCFGAEIFSNSLEAAGVNVRNLTPPLTFDHEKLQEIVTPFNGVKRVFVDLHFTMSLMEFALIHQYFLKRDCEIFINALDDRAPIAKDLTIIAAGLFVTSIINCTGREPKIYGKPSDMIGEYCVQEFQIKDRKRCLFIGDNLHADIEFAFRQGFQSLLVLTGAHIKEDMLLQPIEYQPNYYADSLGDFVEFFNNLTSNVQNIF